MKYFCIISLIVLSIAVPASAQISSDSGSKLTGEWVFASVKSPFAKSNYVGETLNVSAKGVELLFARTWLENGAVVRLTYTLYADGRGEANTVTVGQRQVEEKSNTKWKKDKLVREISPTKNDPMALTRKESYEVSRDGNFLTLTMSKQGAILFGSSASSPIAITYKRKE
jgi:hypothetical protein